MIIKIKTLLRNYVHVLYVYKCTYLKYIFIINVKYIYIYYISQFLTKNACVGGKIRFEWFERKKIHRKHEEYNFSFLIICLF